MDRCISKIHHKTANKESCLWNRCISRTHHTGTNKESCLWNRCISRTHHKTANKESCLWNRCMSRTHHTGTNKRVMSLEQMYLLIHHTGTVKSHMSLEQMYLQIHHTGTVTGSGCHLPCAGGHKTSRPDGPSPGTDAAVPGRPSLSPPRSWSAPGRSREKLLTPSVLASAQRRWNHRPRRVWRRAVAWVWPPVECRRPSAAVVRRVPPLSERRHRHHLHPQGLGRSPGIFLKVKGGKVQSSHSRSGEHL